MRALNHPHPSLEIISIKISTRNEPEIVVVEVDSRELLGDFESSDAFYSGTVRIEIIHIIICTVPLHEFTSPLNEICYHAAWLEVWQRNGSNEQFIFI